MTREEMWKEFEYQLIRETRISMTMSFDAAQRMTKLGIEETVAKWKRRLERTMWIPVSERLPEEDNCTGSGVQFSDDVLMSVLNIVDEEDFIDFGHTIDGEWYSIVEKKRIQNGFDVIAWMPLPRPYDGESEVQDADSN